MSSVMLDVVYYKNVTIHVILLPCALTPLGYAQILQLAHRRFYANNISTPESIVKLNKYDFYHFSLCLMSYAILVSSLGFQIYILDPFFHNLNPKIQEFVKNDLPLNNSLYTKNQNDRKLNTLCYVVGAVFTNLYVICVSFYLRRIARVYTRINRWNFTNAGITEASVVFEEVEYDSEGRAWYCAMFSASRSELGFHGHECSNLSKLKQYFVSPCLLFEKRSSQAEWKKPVVFSVEL
uniref:7TM_GPCR_Srx domain-containing protein n=1 Tax=Panagrellus redivivus TaxID=6233 RepID=A0A7E4WA19_PANRE